MSNHYEVLNLKPSSRVTQDGVKRAYHDALLAHHPDRLKSSPDASQTPTIDQITSAYAVLSNDRARIEYDHSLKTIRIQKQDPGHDGLESYDLEDLERGEQDGQSMWSKSCRCGNEKGYVITESELERADQLSRDSMMQREILVGCQGCSLFIRVTFATDDG